MNNCTIFLIMLLFIVLLIRTHNMTNRVLIYIHNMNLLFIKIKLINFYENFLFNYFVFIKQK